MLLAADEKLAIRDQLQKTIHPRDFKRLFAGLEFGAICEGTIHVYVQNEYCAAQIDALYSPHIISALKAVSTARISRVNVLPKDFGSGTVYVLANRRGAQSR